MCLKHKIGIHYPVFFKIQDFFRSYKVLSKSLLNIEEYDLKIFKKNNNL